MPYTSIAQNLTSTGVDRLIFKVSGPGPGFSVIHYDQDETILQNLQQHKYWIGSLSGERVSDTLLQELARHPANPFKLSDNLNYVVSNYDHNLVEYGTIDGERCVWDQLIAPHLKDYGISTDPGVVPRNAPEGLGVQPPIAEDAEATLQEAIFYAMKAVAGLGATLKDGTPLIETATWKNLVEPLLANPLMSS